MNNEQPAEASFEGFGEGNRLTKDEMIMASVAQINEAIEERQREREGKGDSLESSALDRKLTERIRDVLLEIADDPLSSMSFGVILVVTGLIMALESNFDFLNSGMCVDAGEITAATGVGVLAASGEGLVERVLKNLKNLVIDEDK